MRAFWWDKRFNKKYRGEELNLFYRKISDIRRRPPSQTWRITPLPTQMLPEMGLVLVTRLQRTELNRGKEKSYVTRGSRANSTLTKGWKFMSLLCTHNIIALSCTHMFSQHTMISTLPLLSPPKHLTAGYWWERHHTNSEEDIKGSLRSS